MHTAGTVFRSFPDRRADMRVRRQAPIDDLSSPRPVLRPVARAWATCYHEASALCGVPKRNDETVTT